MVLVPSCGFATGECLPGIKPAQFQVEVAFAGFVCRTSRPVAIAFNEPCPDATDDLGCLPGLELMHLYDLVELLKNGSAKLLAVGLEAEVS